MNNLIEEKKELELAIAGLVSQYAGKYGYLEITGRIFTETVALSTTMPSVPCYQCELSISF